MASRCLRHLRRPLSSLLQFPQHLAMLVPRQTYHPYHPTEDKPQEGHVVGGTGEAGRRGGREDLGLAAARALGSHAR